MILLCDTSLSLFIHLPSVGRQGYPPSRVLMRIRYIHKQEGASQKLDGADLDPSGAWEQNTERLAWLEESGSLLRGGGQKEISGGRVF